ncbi:DUF2726 domain-containing protein [Pandoraea fibrosis]
MTARERAFFVSLRSALPLGVEVYSQVSMGALVSVSQGSQSARNRFDRKIFDFVVCNASGDVLYAIELDDASHARSSAQRRDDVKNSVCAAANLPLIRYRSVRTDASALRADYDRISKSSVRSSSVISVESVKSDVPPTSDLSEIVLPGYESAKALQSSPMAKD